MLVEYVDESCINEKAETAAGNRHNRGLDP